MPAARVIVVVALAVLLTLAGSAAAGPPGQWTALPGTVVNFAEPGLARTSDGVLHLVYTRKNGTKEELAHVTVSTGGKVGSTAVALGGWASMSHLTYCGCRTARCACSSEGSGRRTRARPTTR